MMQCDNDEYFIAQNSIIFVKKIYNQDIFNQKSKIT